MKKNILSNRKYSTPVFSKQAFARLIKPYSYSAEHLTEIELLWYKEWKQFAIVCLPKRYLLLDGRSIVFSHPCFDTVQHELIERAHFYQKEQNIRGTSNFPDD